MKNSKDCLILDLINDPTCVAMMVRDGIKAHDVLNLLRTIKPMVAMDNSYRHRRGQAWRHAA